MSEKKLNLYQKLVQIRKKVLYIQKTTQGNFGKYAAGSSIIAEIRTEMDNQNVLLVPSMEEFKPIVRDGAKNVTAQCTISYTWIDADDPTTTLKTQLTMMDDKGGCQGVGSVLTYAERYFLCKFFQIATDKDDPDVFIEKHGLDKPEKEIFAIENVTEKLIRALSLGPDNLIKHYMLQTIAKSKSDSQMYFEKCLENPEKFRKIYDEWRVKNVKIVPNVETASC